MERECTGKWGGAVSIEEEQAAPVAEEREGAKAKDSHIGRAEIGEKELKETPAEIEELFSPETHVYTIAPHMNIVDLYEVGHKTITRAICNDAATEIPFAHQIKIHGLQGEVVRLPALFDGAAMVAAMCTSLFNLVKHRLGSWQPSQKLLRMANGTIVPSQARWEGAIQLVNVTIRGSFEVFDSGGSWAFLLGKPLLRRFKAKQDFETDTVSIQAHDGSTTTLRNELSMPKAFEFGMKDTKNINLTLDIKQFKWTSTEPRATEANTETNPTCPVYVTNEAESTILTRDSNPFKAERVARILQEVTIGPDVTGPQREEIHRLLTTYADCFALAIKEVNAIPGAVHRLNIPKGATFRTKVPPRSYNPDQRAFVESKVNEMLEAGIIRPIHPRDVRFVAQTVLAQKTHNGQGLPLNELKHRINDQCSKNGLPGEFDMPPRPEPSNTTTDRDISDTKQPTKWRLCQDFNGVNRLTEVAPIPQGDIRAKQLRLSGHRYIHVFDFAAGFYGIEIHPDSQPYITFYVEGRGYFAYQRMPFGVTGGPSEFGHVTAQRFHDLIAKAVLELFVDDGGIGSDSFQEGMEKLTSLLERVRREKMSLSPSKLQLFMTEAVFAGAQVGPQGVTPDTAKLTAIVDWPIPDDASHLEGFLGLTSYFRDLIKGYARLEAPLRNILRQVNIPAGTKKQSYQRIMKAHKLKELWTPEHTKTFIALKAQLVSEPVLSAPRYDGTPFILTTDGCTDAFAGVLSQKITTSLPGGKVVSRLHPIAFASKRTSKTEEKYKPFLLEFAALKFSFDKFSDIVYGYPVEVETDCQALRDVLMNDKLSATHARWRDSVLAHNIVDVRHVPGVTNIADGISRQYEMTEKTSSDGSEYTVNPDWEKQAGLVYDIYNITPSPENAALRERFKSEPLFLDVIDSLEGIKNSKNLRDQKRAQHRALHYMIEDDKLWYIAGGTRARAKSRQECVTQEEAVHLAKEEHEKGGHWHRDSIKIALLDRIYSPRLDQSIVKAIVDCARCKNFGGTHLHSLLQPITRRHPFELLVGDYLSLPTGKGGYHTVGLYLDTFSQHVWGDMFKTAGSAKTTNKSLDSICNTYAPPDTFMCDGGRHFNNNDVKENCAKWGIKQHVTPAYSPWVNGLVEGTNKLLLYVLARLCAPEVGEDGWQAMKWDKLPKTWPDHFQEAIQILNWRILPALKFSPKELMLGLVINTANTPLEASTSVLTPADIDKHFTYAAQQRLDGYTEAIHHAIRRKATFDKKVLKSRAGVVTFKKGQLVQAYRSDLMNTLSTDRKLQPTWSGPYRIQEQILNSYKLEELDGTPRSGEYSARRLRAFIPREGTELARLQREVEERIAREGMEGNTEVAMGMEDPDNETNDEGKMDDGGEEEDSNIASRVASRRGRRQKDGGGWNR
jgi:hypothetical protein